ncbi:hypothetical protein A6R68_01899, partial [Neotoma lepida]
MDVKCPGCYKITTVFSHAQTMRETITQEAQGSYGLSSSEQARVRVSTGPWFFRVL